MAKICIPKYGNGKFESLKDAYIKLKQENYGLESLHFLDIVQYNVFYRDILRKSGWAALKEFVISEVPELRNEQEIFKDLENEFAHGISLGDYDIQCYDVHDSFTLMGHTFKNLADVQSHKEIIASPFISSLSIYRKEDVIPYSDIHIGELYDDYPKFDSSDDCDNRTYQNYFFRKNPITKDNIYETFKIGRNFNFCFIHENIPQELLPILYYEGDGKYMLLASSKLQTMETNK